MTDAQTTVSELYVARTPIVERLAWAWTDLFEQGRISSPPWAVAMAICAALYGGSLLLALIANDLETFMEDPRWLASHLIVGACAYYMVRLPQNIDRFWESIEPWLADGTAMAAVRASTRGTLARFFGPGVLILALFVAFWMSTNEWGEDFESPVLAPVLHLLYGLPMAYFLAGAIAFNSVGLWTLLRRVAKRIDFRPGMIPQRGKTALQPFNQLLLGNWVFGSVIIVLSAIASAPLREGEWQNEDLIVLALIGVLSIVLVMAQLSMNGVLAREKAQELAVMRAQLSRAAELPAGAEAVDVLARILRVQTLLHDLGRVETFNPTLLDLRFAIQVALSVMGIVIANILMRTIIFA